MDNKAESSVTPGAAESHGRSGNEYLAGRPRALLAYWPIFLGAVVVGILTTCAIYLQLPSGHHSTLKFRLLFDGAEDGEYPSGVRFGANDIISKPILHEVYERNNLARFGAFDDFQTAFHVAITPSPDLRGLASEYSIKLASRKLTAVDQARLEKEYKEKREGLSRGLDHELNMDLTMPVTSAMPNKTRVKVMKDLLNTWAEEAAETKGAVRYQIAVLSKNILPKEFILGEDFFVASDILRLKLRRVVRNIDQMLHLPGAMSFRTSQEKLSLSEIRMLLNDTHRFKLIPIMHQIRTFGLAENAERTRDYIQGRIYNIKLAKTTVAGRVKVLTEALAAYSQVPRRTLGLPQGARGTSGQAGAGDVPALIPQIGDSFLDRIIEMAQVSDDLKFKQSYTDRITEEGLLEVEQEADLQLYTDMLEALTEKGTGEAKLTPEKRAKAVKEVKGRIQGVYEEMVTRVSQTESIYEEISTRNLNPRSQLYAEAEPVVTIRQRSAGAGKMLVYGALITVLLLFAAAVGCSIHARAKVLASGRGKS